MAFRMSRIFWSWPKRLLLLSVILIIILIILLKDEMIYRIFVKEIHRTFTKEIDFKSLNQKRYIGCDGNFIGYGNQYAVLKNVVLEPRQETFYLPCRSFDTFQYSFDYGREGTHLNTWLSRIRPYDSHQQKDLHHILNDRFTVALLRYEYANMYHTMTDWYNVFFLTKQLGISPHNISVLLFDSHQKGHFDKTWRTLFGDVQIVKNFSRPVKYQTLAWNMLGYESPINFHGLSTIPFISSFREFFIQRHGIEATKDLNCKTVSILFLWRRDYVAHPNNPSGMIKRKIENEEELVTFLKTKYPSADIQGKQFDKLNFHEQLNFITKTDILVSMHGAGLSHVLFMPKHAGLVEIFTTYWPKYGMTHFKSMARWVGLKYESLQNLNPSNEHKDFYTYIPPFTLYLRVDSIYRDLCPG